MLDLVFRAWAVEWIQDAGSYFSVKNIENTQTMGLLWGSEYKLNHEFVDDSITLSVPYADPGKFYSQTIKDPSLSLSIIQTWQIFPEGWVLSYTGSSLPNPKHSTPKLVNLIFYLALSEDHLNYDGSYWSGSFPFTFKTSSNFIVRAVKTEKINEKAWKVKKFVQKWLHDSSISNPTKISYGLLTPANEPRSNFIFIQVQSQPPFHLEIIYKNPPQALIHESISLFSEKFSRNFGKASFNGFETNTLSYLLSGLSFLEGPIKVKKNGEVHETSPRSLLTFVPSRSTFPRGFLWDEGFHLLVVQHWDLDLSLKVFESWLDTMDENGWICREQIRGPAAETRVPEQFIPQSEEIANPPSFVFLIENLLEQVKTTPPEHFESNKIYKMFKSNYGKLKKWLYWLINTQVNIENLPMWKGRTAGHNLASGLDDYPRGLQVSEHERHLDLYMWQIKFTQLMLEISKLLENSEDSQILMKEFQRLKNLEEKFLDHDGIFKDFLGEQFIDNKGNQPYLWRGDNQCGNVKNPLGSTAECNPYSDFPCCSEFGWCGNTKNHCSCEKCKVSEKLENRKNFNKKFIFSPHIGYVNLMPLIVGYVKIGSMQYEKIMDYLMDPKILWSEFGIRSLSKGDLLFKTGENYWKGEIWMNFNFMVVRALKKYYWECERAQRVYGELRRNLVRNLGESWNQTGYLWEQYSEENGKGLRVHPFTGWSSLILNIIYEKF